ncbi:hypothetical protein [Helicobacter sp. T3_23-1056]
MLSEVLRGNPQCNTESIDCHDFATQNLAMTKSDDLDCHADFVKSARNDRSRINAYNNSVGVDCHALDLAKMQNLIARNDGNRIIVRNDAKCRFFKNTHH